MPEYTLATGVTMIVVVLLELLWLRTGVFRSWQYWISMAIVLGFQVLVDGWLTKLSDPIVIYDPDRMLGVRWPFDIPVEDFGFGFAMVTLVIIVWKRTGRKDEADDGRAAGA
ncbi:lycopene cyclase domain-containing protein [Leucobacter ruminantium]|uniref:Lycopene cyclase domain-containing protein n=1 Tax=Leucobacter ruminantium TaxID=1289170 RepID=A0A939LTG4_9MICO|nr:lycopene cyclase domain-containing protein [Leucobacter ruminantium]MBO1804439.1 lycopene cyclase domain-containing protein [Leucobacter ruminantium]